MSALLRRLLDPAYLYAVDPGPLGRWRAVYVAWMVALLLFLLAALWLRRRDRRPEAAVAAWASGVGLAWLALRLLAPRLSGALDGLSPAARYLLFEAWTARVWPISATLLAGLCLALALVAPLALPPIVRRQVDALAGRLGEQGQTRRFASTAHTSPSPAPAWEMLLLGGVHLAGLSLLWHLAERPAWWSVPSLILLSALPLLARPRRLRLETLAPLFPAYLSALAYVWLSQRLHVDVDAYQGFGLPDPWSPWFNVPALAVGGIAYAYVLLLQLRVVLRRGSLALRTGALPAIVAIGAVLWLGGTAVVHRTHGVTASDPYCYAQMAIDLAETGSPLHRFPLAGLARDLGLPTWPTVHIGYHPPGQDGRATTMWSAGWPALLAPLYRLGGLPALYWGAPAMALLALIATWLLANEALRGRSRGLRLAVAALACALTATSPEGAERMLVPMADAAAQLFTVLTLWLVLRGSRTRPVWHGLCAGACLGMAYWVRHPQLPLALAALAAALLSTRRQGGRGWGIQAAALGAFAAAALVVAIPDLSYHARAFGGWLHTESTEWFLLSPSNVARSFWAILQQGLLRREEVGFVAPFGVYGAWLLWRTNRRPAAILAAGAGAVFLFHLCYAAVRPRDLIAILPVLYLCAAYGFVVAWRLAGRRGTLGAALWLLCGMALLAARSERALALPWREDVITFGYVRPEQREGLLALGELTPADAVIGSMLNGGAIELYAGRAAVHPAPWTEPELWRWADALLEQGHPFYVLDDGEEMPAVLDRLRPRYRVRAVQQLNLPYFALGGGNLPRPAWLYAIERAPAVDNSSPETDN